MSDPEPTIDLTPTPARVSSTGQAEATYFFAGRASQTTTTTAGDTTTTAEVGVAGGVRYTSADRNGNGTADLTLDASAFFAQSLEARYGVRVEGRQEISDSGYVFGRVQADNRGAEAVVGLAFAFGGGGQGRAPGDPTEATGRALDRELGDVYRDPGAVRERLDALDRGTDPRGLTFGEVAGRLYAPQAAGLVEGGGLTEKGASETERFETLVAYANHREAQLGSFAQGPYGADFARLVQDKERVIGGFQAAYGDGWGEAYGRFSEALRTGGIERAVAGLPPGDPAATSRLREALGVQDSLEARYPEGMVTGAREQAEINQFRRDAGAPSETPERTREPERSPESVGHER